MRFDAVLLTRPTHKSMNQPVEQQFVTAFHPGVPPDRHRGNPIRFAHDLTGSACGFTQNGLRPGHNPPHPAGGVANWARCLPVPRTTILQRKEEPGDDNAYSDTWAAEQELNIPLPVTSLLQQMLGALVNEGESEANHSAILKFIEDLSKVEVNAGG